MDAALRCQVSPGMFSGEVAVRGIAADGAEFSLFVADEFVESDAPVGDSEPVEGWLLSKCSIGRETWCWSACRAKPSRTDRP